MAVQDIIRGLYGTYEPTNIYSFEFRNSFTGKKITEIFFQLPPESVEVNESQRADLTPTLTGGYVCDFGNEFKNIKIAGSTHFYHVANSNDGSVPFDGYTEFMKLRFMIIRYRDYTMTRGGKLKSPSFSGQGLGNVNALKNFAKKYGSLAGTIDVIYHDYDYDEHFQVKVDEFTVRRSKEDVFSIMYDLSMRGFQVDQSKAANRKPKKIKKTVQSLNDAIQQMKNFHAESLPSQIPKITLKQSPLPDPNTTSDTAPPITADLVNSERLYSLNRRLMRTRGYYEWALDQVRANVMSMRHALRTANDYLNNNLIEEDSIEL